MKFIFYFLLSIIFLSFVSEVLIRRFTYKDIFERPDLIVFLGCGNQTQSPLLNDRILKLIEAHKKFPDVPILISGNETEKKEVSSVLSFLENQIPTQIIAQDPDAKRTIDTFIYVQKNFPSKKLYITTNSFHFDRSKAIGNLLGFEVQGTKEDINFETTFSMQMREKLAKIKFLWDYVFILFHK